MFIDRLLLWAEPTLNARLRSTRSELSQRALEYRSLGKTPVSRDFF